VRCPFAFAVRTENEHLFPTYSHPNPGCRRDSLHGHIYRRADWRYRYSNDRSNVHKHSVPDCHRSSTRSVLTSIISPEQVLNDACRCAGGPYGATSKETSQIRSRVELLDSDYRITLQCLVRYPNPPFTRPLASRGSIAYDRVSIPLSWHVLATLLRQRRQRGMDVKRLCPLPDFTLKVPSWNGPHELLHLSRFPCFSTLSHVPPESSSTTSTRLYTWELESHVYEHQYLG